MTKWLGIVFLFSTASLHAEPVRLIFDTDITGDVDDVQNDGFTRFHPAGKDGKGSQRDRFLTMDAVQQARALEAVVQLTVQPPR